MRILDLRALRGPNFHSRYPTVHMLLDIGELEETPSDRLPGFTERLVRALPSLREHRCSPGYPGGFVERLERGTWAAHIVEHVAIELQVLAGMRVGFGKTRETRRRGVYTVAFRYRDEEAGLQAARDAMDVVAALAARKPVDVAPIVQRLREAYETNRFGPSTGSIVAEARRRGIPVRRLDSGSHVQLGHGVRQRRLQATMTDATSGLGVEIADDKQRTKDLLGKAGVPVPQGEEATEAEEAVEVASRIGYPVTIKPLVGNHGRGITTGIRDEEELRRAFPLAKAVYQRVVVERHLVGCDFRILVINHRFVAAARRDPAHVIGDGRRTVRELVEVANQDPRRGEGHERPLTRIKLDESAISMLARAGLTPDSVPPEGDVVLLRSTGNISSGGTATDVTDEVHPAVRTMAERVSRIVGLDVMGIDVVAPHLRAPLKETGGGIVEVNAAPGFRMHLEPSYGQPRNVAVPLLDMLFPPGHDGRIPIVAVTGTNGKTTTVRLLAHMLRLNGARVGLTTTCGVEVNSQAVLEGDYSGPAGAEAVLGDPTVDHAVLEVARGGILRRGLGFEECDVGILLNVAGDHLGEGGIDTIEDLARLKGTVVEAVREEGTAVLNAEDPHVLALREKARARRVVLFALDPAHPELRAHAEDGGLAVTMSGGRIVLRRAGTEIPIVDVRDVPITMGGRALFNVQNAMAAVAAAHALGVPEDMICTALTTFVPNPGQLPGRMNVMDMGAYKVLIDYGHNVHALQALAQVIPHLTTSGRVVNLANGSGNRRDEDLRAFGRTLARMYHHVVLCDPDPRGRRPGETIELIHDGLREAGFPDEHLDILPDERDALEAALDAAQEGDLVVIQADDVAGAIRQVRARQLGAPPMPSAPGAPAPRAEDARARVPR